jgi:hypothetical protein
MLVSHVSGMKKETARFVMPAGLQAAALKRLRITTRDSLDKGASTVQALDCLLIHVGANLYRLIGAYQLWGPML